jgi:adenylate cyclase
MEGLTKGVARILVSRETRDACNGAFDFVARGTYRVKGRAQDTEVFEPIPPAVAAAAQRT